MHVLDFPVKQKRHKKTQPPLLGWYDTTFVEDNQRVQIF
jgi:hypothetical protein